MRKGSLIGTWRNCRTKRQLYSCNERSKIDGYEKFPFPTHMAQRVYLTITQLQSHLPCRITWGSRVVFIISSVRFPRESLPHALSLSRPMQFLHPSLKGDFITLLKAFAI